MAETNRWIYIAVLILSWQYLSLAAEICFRGQRLYTPFKGPKVCLWCEHGQFMPVEKHSHSRCYPCTTIENTQLEKLVSQCNSTHDTEIHCIDGYFRTQPSYPEDRGHCQPCTKCLFPTRPCRKYSDTVCCAGNDYAVYVNKEGHPICVRECGLGHFLDWTVDQCLPCPQHTYMDESNHVNHYCKNCEIPKSQKEKIVRPCNATHPSVIDCVASYSRQVMDIDQPELAECVKVCGPSQYLDLETDTCRTCPENTYMDEDKHSYSRCKTCEVPRDRNEKIVQSCNKTHPAILGCVEGFYRQLSDDLMTISCFQCRNCSESTDGNVYERRACGETSNSVCCPQPGMEVLDVRDGPVCVFLPTNFAGSPTCGEGEFLSTSDSLICQPCPQGSYMDKIRHTSGSCKSCQEFPNRKHCDDYSIVNRACEGKTEDGQAMNSVTGLTVGQAIISLFMLIQVVIFCVLRQRRRRRKLCRRGSHDDKEIQIPLLCRLRPENTLWRRAAFGSSTSKIKHNEFIPITQFNNVHLPYQYCNDIMVDLVKLQAKLTTFIKVNRSSDRRPQLIPSTTSPYPYSQDRYRNEPHTGSGWVHGVKMYTDIPCPCQICQLFDMPMKQWGEVMICTATTVVFDMTEGKNCQCYFFYENADNDLMSCPSLDSTVKVVSDVDRDWCYIAFVTHDMELVQKLQEMFTRYHRLRREVQHKHKVVTDDTSYTELTYKLPILHDKFEQSLNLLGKEMAEIQKYPDRYSRSAQLHTVTSYGCKLQDQSSCFKVLLDLTTTADQGDENRSLRLLHMLSMLHRNFSHSLKDIVTLKEQLQQAYVDDEDLALDMYRDLWIRQDELDRFLQHLMLDLGNLVDISPYSQYFKFQPRYNSDHALTIIVSHPEGRSQQVSIGEVIDRKGFWYDHHSMYGYTNRTSQGCEGARVFILGRTGLSDHSHSGNVGHVGESGAWSDIISYIINLSTTAEQN